MALDKNAESMRLEGDIKAKKRTGDIAQVIECLLSKCEVLSSDPSTAKKL
jgi:hypothetical protein